MPFSHMSQFDRARRRYLVVYERPQAVIAGVRGANIGGHPVPRYAPVTILLEGSDQYVETNGCLIRVNGVNTYDGVQFIPPPWGEPEAVDSASWKVEFSSEGSLVHSFNQE